MSSPTRSFFRYIFFNFSFNFHETDSSAEYNKQLLQTLDVVQLITTLTRSRGRRDAYRKLKSRHIYPSGSFVNLRLT